MSDSGADFFAEMRIQVPTFSFLSGEWPFSDSSPAHAGPAPEPDVILTVFCRVRRKTTEIID